MACILITGGAGFIGSHTAEALLRRGDSVRILDNLSTGRADNLGALEAIREAIGAPASALLLHQGDLRSDDDVAAAVDGVEAVLHIGALPSVQRSCVDPLTSHEVNATGALRLLIAARHTGIRRFVLASSSSVYGNAPELPKTETSTPQPVSPYAASKLAAEHYCQLMYRQYGMETIVLRYFNVFGERQDPTSQYAAVIPRFIKAALCGKPIEIYGDGEQSRDFTYIDNVVHANLLALEAPYRDPALCNVATGRRTTINSLIELLGSLHGSPLEVRSTPPRAGDVRHSLAALEAARRLLGYEPRVTFEDGLRRTYEAAQQQHQN